MIEDASKKGKELSTERHKKTLGERLKPAVKPLDWVPGFMM